MTALLEAAVGYARRGWRVLPLHTILNGACTCGNVNCNAPAKHPRITGGVHAASSDVDMIRRWWASWPDSNIALACGGTSGVLAVDVDPRHGGFDSIMELETNVDLPPTLKNNTGGGGFHLIYRIPSGVTIRNRIGWLPGVDVKADGGYVVLPPSRHVSGGVYAWDVPDQAVAQLPQFLAADFTRDAARDLAPLAPTGDILAGVPEGSRNNTLFRAACRWRRQLRDDRPGVRALVLAAAASAQPPMAIEEAEVILESAFRQDHADPGGLEEMLALVEQGGGAIHEVESQSDEGNARRLARRHSNELRYVENWGWVFWDGARWAKDEVNYSLLCARRTVASIYEEANAAEEAEVREALALHARRSEHASRTAAILALAKSDPAVARPVTAFDSYPMLLNCPNGTLDLVTGEVQSHNRETLITKVTGAPAERGAAAPRWQAFLERILPDQDTRDWVQKAVGYSLSGSVAEKVMMMLVGSGDNGKSVFVEVLRAVLGDYAVATPTSTIVSRSAGQHPTDLARLRGARFVSAQEPPAGGKLAVELVKEITGGDMMVARYMRQDYFEFQPELKLWLSTNTMPIVGDFGEAIWRRLRIIPFTVVIPRQDQVSRDTLIAGFMEEAAGILEWAIEGCLAWQQQGLDPPASVVLATEEQRQDQDWFQMFIEERLIPNDHVSTEIKYIYMAFRAWCEARGEHVWTQNSVTRELKRRGFLPTKIGSARGFAGVQVILGDTLSDL